MDDDADVERRPRVLVGLLGVLLVVVLATVLVLLRDRQEAAGIEAQRPADVGNAGWQEDSAGRAVVAARTAASTYFTLDHRRLERDMEAMRDLGTDDFVDRYDERATALAQRVRENRLVLSARLVDDGTATEWLVTDRARVLVSVDVTTRRGDAARTTRYRTRVALDLVDGRWRVATLDEVA